MAKEAAAQDPVAAKVDLLILDVDGVLTDGSIFLDDLGRETKRFNVRDGFGIKLWQKLGMHAAIITGRVGKAVQYRATELRIQHVIQGSKEKGKAAEELIKRLGIGFDKVACLADDWPDLAMMKLVGYPMAVADADSRVKKAASFVTKTAGGHGAAREAVEHLLSSKGLMEQALKLYD